MMSDAQAFLFNAPWAALFPGLTAALLLVGVNYLGEGENHQPNRKPHLRQGKSQHIRANDSAAPSIIPVVSANSGDTAAHNPPLLRVYALAAGVVQGATLTINDGECVGIAGESGAGKTTLALALFGLSAAGLNRVGGGVYFRGRDITALDEKERAAFLAKETGFVFQDPQSTLNPLMRVGKQVAERLLLQSAAHAKTAAVSEVNSRVRAAFRDVGLPDDNAFLRRYPHELSGGQQQRVVIAAAIIHRPSLIIADEPPASLDPGIREDIAALLERLAREQSSALLLVSHDWPLLVRMCPRIYVMYQGEFVEEGAPKDILAHPRHPYTQAVVKAMPSKEKRGQDL
jgi:ABC-type dipeptide/oligopeptide/nickel transport system ATPase component